MMLDELRRTAQTRGIATSFTDAGGRLYEVSEATLEAVLAAMGPTPERRDWPPVVVARQGWRHPWRPPAGEPATLELASGEERPLPAELPGDLPVGRHRVAGRTGATNLVVAPARCHLPASLEAGERAWGWAAQLYAVRSAASWGIGDLGDLAGLLASTASLGAGFALLNPLHAASPGEPSPYNPSTRVFRNPLYLRIEAVPELAALAGAERARVEALASDGRDLNGHHRVDRMAAYRLKDEALRLAYAALDRLPERRAGLAACRAATPDLERFATFCAIQHAEGRDWRDWPAAYRHPGRPEVAEFGARHAAEVGYHAWLQWLLDEQLAAATPVDNRTSPTRRRATLPVGAPRPAGAGSDAPGVTGLGVLNDLAIGFAPDGFDAWSFQDEPAEGTYVRYPADDLLGVLALESVAAEALVVGEDLGTVEHGVRERLAAEGVLSYRLAWFEHGPGGGRRRAADYPRLALAATTTHDLPTVAGFFSGSDLAHLAEIGAATLDERPNWSLPLPVPLDDLAADPRVRRLAGILSSGLNRSLPEAERKS